MDDITWLAIIVTLGIGLFVLLLVAMEEIIYSLKKFMEDMIWFLI